MHTISEYSVPAFLAKLWKLVEDPETDDLICWSPSGKSFFIRNQAQFAKELLPHYYKHNNMASFVRQLNMYGFHKKVSVELGGLKCDKDEMEFAHLCFIKGAPELVERIKRKMTSTKIQDPGLSSFKPEVMNKVLVEVRSMRSRQEHFDSKMVAMKHENEALWRELAMLRQKNLKQQQIVNKLIHFLVTLVQPSRGNGIAVKRRYHPLMIDDLSRPHKQTKLSKPQTSPTGPVIHELDSSEPDLESQYFVAEMLENENPTVQSPQEHIEFPIDDDNMETVHLIEDPSRLETSTKMDSPHEIDSNQMDGSHEIDAKKKRASKGKKKNLARNKLNLTRRKNKVPVKIFIPSLENEASATRKELHLVEMPEDERTPMRIALQKNKKSSGIPRSIPIATMPSSKLAAMAANMKKENDDIEENSVDIEDDTETLDNDPSIVKLEDILIVPEFMNNDVQNESENKGDVECNRGYRNRGHNKIDNGESILIANDNVQCNALKLSRDEKDNQNRASTSSSKDLSLSCVNSDANYREEFDNHLDTMQTNLDNAREYLRNEFLRGDGYSIDANTLLGLFDKDDSMTLDLPVNQELNLNSEKENDNTSIIPDASNNVSVGGELITYNPPPNLMDFDDILLGNESSSSPIPSDLPTNNLYTSYTGPLQDLDENSFFDALVPNDMNTPDVI
ncbi:heat shock factor protein-like isoform X2 [Linepithema humile]|uniref:heat shock factor protein-like isoform X2 n=1 Tax=Linepithema humile TaxID=83485 RepID=UPI0006236128|nr:PREDICTED: heat shock factor protein-like isoform X2 [Linepithema humile]